MIFKPLIIFVVLSAGGAGTLLTCRSKTETPAMTTDESQPIDKGMESIPVQPEEYRVYSAFVRTRIFDGDRLVLISDATVPVVIDDPGNKILLNGLITQLSGRTVQDFRAKNAASATMHDSFDLPVAHTLVAGKVIQSMMSGGPEAWRDFTRKYQGARNVFRFSRVGFNNSKDEALLFVNGFGGPGGGFGGFAWMVKEQGSWKVRTFRGPDIN